MEETIQVASKTMAEKNEALYYAGLHLIKVSDDGLSTDKLKQAIEDLKLTIYARENVPF